VAVAEGQGAVGQVDQGRVVRGDQGGHLAGVHHRPQQVHDGPSGLRVELAGRLVGDQHLRFVGQRTGHRHPLLLTTGQLVRALRTINAELGVTVVVVTHDHAVADQVRRTVAIRDGRTASEVRRTARTAEDGSTETVSEEYAVLDRSGRMQLPAAFVEALSLRDRVRLNLEPDHVEVRSGQEAPGE
jgi:putative ABC transport system ATP-binding protein